MQACAGALSAKLMILQCITWATVEIVTSHFIFMALGTLLIDTFSTAALTYKENVNTVDSG
jgi:hypothetical protein